MFAAWFRKSVFSLLERSGQLKERECIRSLCSILANNKIHSQTAFAHPIQSKGDVYKSVRKTNHTVSAFFFLTKG